MKICGFNHGLFGDSIISTVACRVVKELYPDSELTFALSKSYGSILPLFQNHPHIDKFHIWNGGETGLVQSDVDYIKENKFDIVFDPFPKHSRPDWYNHTHYSNECLKMHGLPMTHDLQCYLNPYFYKEDKDNNYVVITAFPSNGTNLTKTLTVEKWNQIVDFIHKLGYKTIQLGGHRDIALNNTERPELDWLSAAKILYFSKLQITADTGWSQIGSAYEHNILGLYSCNYPDMINPFSHMPVNPNSKYLWRRNIQDIPMDEILTNIEEKLK